MRSAESSTRFRIGGQHIVVGRNVGDSCAFAQILARPAHIAGLFLALSIEAAILGPDVDFSG
jgi:hypothetical protein